MSEARPPRVLVVDDEARIRNVLCDALETWGLAADSASDSTQALELFARRDYDLVLTDFLMPGGSGLDLIEGVRTANPSVAVIMLTASSADLEAPSRRLEFAVLRKPLEFEGLRAAISEALGGRSR